MYDLIFFDCDGVLVDSEVMSAVVTVEILSEHGVTISKDEAIDVFAGKNLQIATAIALETYGVTLPDDYPDHHEVRLLKLFQTELTAIDGVADLLARLSTPMCVTSNSGHNRLAHALERTNLTRYFGNNVFSAEDVANGKPAPDLFYHAARAFGADLGKCVTVDDSTSGIEGAIAAGARAIGFCGGSHVKNGHEATLLAAGAETVVHNMRDLHALLGDG